jgi:hypothetical protein
VAPVRMLFSMLRNEIMCSLRPEGVDGVDARRAPEKRKRAADVAGQTHEVEPPKRGCGSYSLRSAGSGSSRAARRAGSHVAPNATAARKSATAPKVTGSAAPTP